MAARRRVTAAGPRGSRAVNRRRTRTLPPWLRWGTLALALLLGVAGTFWLARWLRRPHPGRGARVVVVFPPASTASSMADQLAHQRVVDHPRVFEALLVLTGVAGSLPEGTMVFRDDLSPRAVLQSIAAGRVVVRVTVPEGLTRFEIAHRLEEKGAILHADEFVRRTEDPALRTRLGIPGSSMEGYLFPDTYEFPPESPVDAVLERMTAQAQRRIQALLEAHPDGVLAWARLGVDRHALVTLASMVEREAGVPEDRARVAAVFQHRLADPAFTPHLLQSDPTVVYGCRVAHPPSCPSTPATGAVTITRAMLNDAQNPYNTYTRAGLPPGPIASPGAASIEAVLVPAATEDLYFVAAGGGRSAFARTLEEHRRNVERYLRRPSSDGAVTPSGHGPP